MYYLLSLSVHGSEMSFFHEDYYSSSVDIRWGFKNIVLKSNHQAKFFLVLKDCEPFEVWAPWDEFYRTSGIRSEEELETLEATSGGHGFFAWYRTDPKPIKHRYANHLPGYLRWEQFYGIAICEARQFLSAKNYRFQQRTVELNGTTYTVLTIMDSQYVFTGNAEYIGKFGFREVRTWKYTGRELAHGVKERFSKKERQLLTLHVNSTKQRIPWNQRLQLTASAQTSWRGAVRSLVSLREQM